MAGTKILGDESGAVTTDWMVLTAGILILGFIVVMQVMGNSSGYLMDEFESLNREYEHNAVALSELRRDDILEPDMSASEGEAAVTSR